MPDDELLQLTSTDDFPLSINQVKLPDIFIDMTHITPAPLTTSEIFYG